MEFESIINCDSNIEEIKIIYSGDEYRWLLNQKIYDENYFDGIDVDLNGIIRHHYFIKQTIKKPVFYLFCDIMNINFNHLVLDLSAYLKSGKIPNYIEIENIISAYNVALAETKSIERIIKIGTRSETWGPRLTIEQQLYNVYSDIIGIQFYVQELSNIGKLADANTFRLFAYQLLDVNLQPCFSLSDNTFYETSIYALNECIYCSNMERASAVHAFFEQFITQLENDNYIAQTFSCNLVEYLCATFYQLLEKGYSIKKCENCGGYFVPYNRSDTLYCDRHAPQDKTKTCKEYGASKAYLDNLKNNEAKGLFRKIYMAKQMLVKRNPDIPEYAESFKKYKTQSKQWKADVKAGIKTEQEYIEWLKAVKEKKVL